MMQQIIFRAKIKWIYYLFGFLFSVVLFFFFYTTYYKSYSDPYIKLNYSIIAILFLVLSVGVLYYFLSLKNIILYQKKFEFVSFFGLKRNAYSYSEIESWIIQEKESKGSNWKTLILILKNGKELKLTSYLYSRTDFYKIHKQLTSEKTENKQLKQKKEYNYLKKSAWIAFIASGIFIIIAYSFISKSEVSKEELIEIKGTLKEDINIVKLNKGGEVLVIKLNEYPDFEFTIGSVTLRHTNFSNLINDYKKDSFIAFKIKTEDYQIKIEHPKTISVFNFSLNFDKIPVVEISQGNFTYLSLDDYNRGHKKNNNIGFVFFMVVSFVLAYYGIKANKEATSWKQ